MLNTVVIFLAGLSLLHSAVGQSITITGQCPNVNGVANFNVAGYLGQWYEIARYPQTWQRGQCDRATYSQAGNVVNVLNTDVLDQNLTTQWGTAVLNSNDGTGRLLVTFDVGGFINTADYYILATDYTGYALVYSCRNISANVAQVTSWQLSRNTTYSPAATTAINNYISNSPHLNLNSYQATSQSQVDCFYIPELNPNQNVIVRGTCENLSGQANFDLQRYLGTWNELYSYPTSGNGSCITHQYQQVGGQTQFTSSEVVGLSGNSISGTVTATTNGIVYRTWTVIDGITVVTTVDEFHVVSTDYDSYALILTCSPVNSTYVNIRSSQLSRTLSLTPAAQQAITTALGSHRYLMPGFFLPVDHSADACFHYPEQDGSRVVLPGQCDLNLPIPTNFSIQEFAGTWYQIERYPYPEVDANTTCIGTQLTPVDTGVNIRNWGTVNGTQIIRYLRANVQNATLQVVFTDEVNTATSALHILGTDYQSYAVAYSCVNINQNQRVVGAFKLSRNRTLSANSVNAINALVLSRPELHEPYFLTVPQNEQCSDPSSSFLVRSSVLIVLFSYVISVLV